MLTGEMAQVASWVIVLVAVGMNVKLLVAGLRGAGRKQKPLLARFVRSMIFTIVFLPLILRFLNLPVQATALLWPILILGAVVAAGSDLVTGSRGHTGKKQGPGRVGSPALPRVETPLPSSAGPYPWLESPLQAPGVGTTDRAIARLPLPFHKTEHPPLESALAEAWFERQEARLGRALEGKELASARLRLSTVKSMLLLGYLTVPEADKDVGMVIREGRRGKAGG